MSSINYIVNDRRITVMFSNIKKLLNDEKLEEYEEEFYKEYYDSEGVRFNKEEKSLTFEDQIEQGIYETKTVKLSDFYTQKIEHVVNQIKSRYNNLVFNIAATLNDLTEYDLIFKEELDKMKITASTIKDEAYKLVINSSIEKLENRNVYSDRHSVNNIEDSLLRLQSKASLSQKGKQTKKKIDSTDTDLFNYTSYYFSEENHSIVEYLHDKLISEGFILKCPVRLLKLVLSDKKRVTEVKTKIVWVDQIGLFRFFVVELERIFKITRIKSSKWRIADNCFKIIGKDNYLWSKAGTDTKYGNPEKCKLITSILEEAKQQKPTIVPSKAYSR